MTKKRKAAPSLAQKQLQDIAKAQAITVRSCKKSDNKGFTDTPLFKEHNQTNIFDNEKATFAV